MTANVITSPSEDANELYAEIEEREYQEIPVRETYPEQQNKKPLYEICSIQDGLFYMTGLDNSFVSLFR